MTSDGELCDFYSTSTSLFIMHYFTLTLYLSYCVIVILALLNIFIAMIADTYTKIQSNIDTEWKFVCVSTIMQYANRPVTLPPPYNVFEYLRNAILSCFGRCGRNVINPDGRKTINITVLGSCEYDQLMKKLLYNYFKGRSSRRKEASEKEDVYEFSK
ncbi:transient-receptor-potential-like protein [Glandiceps talaboti]